MFKSKYIAYFSLLLGILSLSSFLFSRFSYWLNINYPNLFLALFSEATLIGFIAPILGIVISSLAIIVGNRSLLVKLGLILVAPSIIYMVMGLSALFIGIPLIKSDVYRETVGLESVQDNEDWVQDSRNSANRAILESILKSFNRSMAIYRVENSGFPVCMELPEVIGGIIVNPIPGECSFTYPNGGGPEGQDFQYNSFGDCAEFSTLAPGSQSTYLISSFVSMENVYESSTPADCSK